MNILVCSLLYFLIQCPHVFASWDPYIDNLIGHSPGIFSTQPETDKACIIGLDGSKWTTDGHLNALKLTDTEAANIASVMKSGDFSTFKASGIVAEGVSYRFFRAHDGVIPGRKKGHGEITLQASKHAIVIGHTREGGVRSSTEKAVSIIVDYLESLGM